MFSLPILLSSFRFTDVERIAVPTISPVHYFRSLRAANTVFVWKERLNPASIIKNSPKIDKTLPSPRNNVDISISSTVQTTAPTQH